MPTPMVASLQDDWALLDGCVAVPRPRQHHPSKDEPSRPTDNSHGPEQLRRLKMRTFRIYALTTNDPSRLRILSSSCFVKMHGLCTALPLALFWNQQGHCCNCPERQPLSSLLHAICLLLYSAVIRDPLHGAAP